MNEQEALATSNDEKRRIRLKDFVDLYTRPRSFFSGRIDLEDKRYLWIVIWSLGITSQFDRFDQEIMRAEMGQPGSVWGLIEPIVTGGWGVFWLWSLGVGVVSAAIVFLVAGWWYKMRLRFSGAVDPDPMQARLVYSYSTFVMTLPHLLSAIAYTIAFPSYFASYSSDEMFSVVLLFMIFWSVAVSYSGATTAFSLHPWKARFWFLALPVGFYVVVLGGIVWLFTLFQ